MWLYRVRTKNEGVLTSVVTEYGLAGAIRFPTWEDFEEFLVESNAYAEEERAKMNKGVPDVFLDAYTDAYTKKERMLMNKDAVNTLLDTFTEDREIGIRQIAEELKKEIEQLQNLGNEKIIKELHHLKKLLNIV